jgi:2'-5' RNA ligase
MEDTATTLQTEQPDVVRARLYEKAWSAFLANCLDDESFGAPAPRRFMWAGTQLSCLIRMDGAPPAVMAAIRRVQRDLVLQAGVMIHPEYFLHITVRMFGEAEESCRGALCAVQDRAGMSLASTEIDEALREALAGMPAFPITLRGTNSWHQAPFIQVFDGGGIRRIRERIAQALPTVEDREYVDGFIPHLTLGYYCDGADLPSIAQILSQRRDQLMGEFVPRAVELVWSRGGSPYPELITIGRYPLMR